MPPEAPDAWAPNTWADVIQPVGLSRLEPIYAVPRPPARRRRSQRTALRLALLVVLPTLLSGTYFGLIAPDRYQAEARFVVRKPNAPNRSPTQGLSIEEGPKGIGGDDAFAVRDYLISRDALQLLLDKADFRGALARSNGDWLWKFPGPVTGHTEEDLYRLYQSLVSIDYDSSTSVTTVDVQAFQPDDAKRIALVLMQGGEALLNRLNERARSDAIHVSDVEVTRAQQKALDAQDQVTAFRDRESIIDPTQLSNTVLTTIGMMMMQLVETRAQLDVTMQASPNSPQIALFRSRIMALQQQIDRERATLAGSDRSLAPRIAEYERLVLLRSFADKSFLSALNLQEAARLDAQRQQAYLEHVVEPHVADEARYPWRGTWILCTFLAGLALFWMFRPSSSAGHA